MVVVSVVVDKGFVKLGDSVVGAQPGVAAKQPILQILGEPAMKWRANPSRPFFLGQENDRKYIVGNKDRFLVKMTANQLDELIERQKSSG